MIKPLIKQVQRLEGNLSVVNYKTEDKELIKVVSDSSLELEKYLEKRNPLSAIQITQQLSTSSGVAHAMAATMALESCLNLTPTKSGNQLRRVVLKLSTIHSHLIHFYQGILPDYLNRDHFRFFFNKFGYQEFYGLSPHRKENENDLPRNVGVVMLSKQQKVKKILQIIQQSIAEISGKFPVIMNFIPGGVSNFEMNRASLMKLIRNLEKIKEFIDKEWPEDVRLFLQSIEIQKNNEDESPANLISFGSGSARNYKQEGAYSPGVYLDGKLEPLSEIKLTELIDSTYYEFNPLNKGEENLKENLNKKDAFNWVKGARYDTEPMLTGALSRMLITHFGGGNSEVSDAVVQIAEDLNLSLDDMNNFASRLLAEVFESRFYLKSVFQILLDFDYKEELNLKKGFNFLGKMTGIGKVESPAGALLHQVHINEGLIEKYKIISASNWNLSPVDQLGKAGIVEMELNKIANEERLNPLEASRILHSYYVNALDATQ